MKHVLKVPRHLKFSTEAPASNPIWISDNLLREAFERFSIGCRRHGSHVPGPLEARRRATRRKNTSIAYSGGSSAPVDTVGLFGPGSQGSWWKQPQLNDSASAERHSRNAQNFGVQLPVHEGEKSLSAVLAWFGKPPAPPKLQIEVDEILPDASRKSLLSGPELKAWEASFQEKLLSTRVLEDLRLLVRKQTLGSNQRLIATTLALQHLLKSSWSSDAVKEFVLDPTLSPSGSRPLRVLVNALRGEWFGHADRAELFDTICEMISLGTASPSDVEYVIKRVPHFRMLQGAAVEQLANGFSIHEYYQRILSAIQESKVTSLKDLDRKFMINWTKAISAAKFSPPAARLLWELRDYSCKSEKQLASTLVFKLFLYDFQNHATTVSETRLYHFLPIVPSAILPYALVNTTESILSLSDHETTQHENAAILHWHALLAGLDEKSILRAFGQTASWRACLSQNVSESGKAQRVVIASWVAVAMSAGRKDFWQHTERHLRKLRLGQVFKELYSDSLQYGTRDILARFLETLQSLPLPNTDLLLRKLQAITDDFLVVHNRDFVVQVAEKSLLRRFSVLENDLQYDNFRNHFNDALVDLAESINKNLSLFLHVSRHYIKRDELAFRVILRVLKHNLAVHHALSQSWPARIQSNRGDVGAPIELAGRQADLNVDSQPLRATTTRSVCGATSSHNTVSFTEQRPQGIPTLDPREVLDLINHLAISFATSPAITPRQALRKVYWCFVMLHRYGAPIESPITRALWHAGITRYGKAGTAKKVLQWILAQIRVVEGDNVAEMLLRSAGFRKQLEEQFADLKSLHDDDAMPADMAGETVVGALQRLEGGGDGVTQVSHQERSSPPPRAKSGWVKPRTVEIRLDLSQPDGQTSV